MNKYKKYAYKTEDKNFVTEEAKLKLLILKFKIKALQYLNKEQIDLLFSFKTWKSFYYMIFELSTFNDEFQNYIINNIISKFSKEALIKYYMIGLCKFSTYENYDQVTKIINSFNSSKIIEDIKFDKEKKLFKLKTNDKKLITFAPLLSDIIELLSYKKKCHNTTQHIIEKEAEKKLLYGITVIEKNLFDKTMYHSFILKDKMMLDYSHNILMKYEDYKYLIKPKVILHVEGKKMLKNIETLKSKDEDFKKSPYVDIIKYALYKQMKRKNKNNKK